jgi:ribokinase
MDLVTKVKRTPKVGETLLGVGFDEIPGGKGANQAVAIGRLGGHVSMLGMVGNDNYGKDLLDNLKMNHVESNLIMTSESKSTGLAIIMVNEDGDNSIVVISGANYEMNPDQITSECFDGSDYLLAQLETPIETIEKAFIWAKEKNMTTILNPAPAKELTKELIAHTDLLIPNETEFEELTGVKPNSEEDMKSGAKILFDMGIQEILLTLGKNGAFYIHKDGQTYTTQSYEVNAVDSTAAGDSFIGGLLTQLAQDRSMEESIEFAMKVGAMTVSRYGAQSSLPTLNEIEGFEGVKRQ